jgi:hypothetical protein
MEPKSYDVAIIKHDRMIGRGFILFDAKVTKIADKVSVQGSGDRLDLYPNLEEFEIIGYNEVKEYDASGTSHFDLVIVKHERMIGGRGMVFFDPDVTVENDGVTTIRCPEDKYILNPSRERFELTRYNAVEDGN